MFAPALLTNELSTWTTISRECLAFIAFALLSSAIYAVNDIRDLAIDQSHPSKKNRPYASGALSKSEVVTLSLVTGIIGAAITGYLGSACVTIALTYVGLQFWYSFGAKHLPIIDVFIISSGFVLRALFGAATISVVASPWLFICTGSIALLIAFSKRRSELMRTRHREEPARPVLSEYTEASLNVFVGITAALSMMTFTMYALFSGTAQKYPGLVATVLWLWLGVLRYVQITFSGTSTEEPEKVVVTDKVVLSAVLLFTLTLVLAIKGMTVPGVSLKN